jgi:hypothetical protein
MAITVIQGAQHDEAYAKSTKPKGNGNLKHHVPDRVYWVDEFVLCDFFGNSLQRSKIRARVGAIRC